MKLQHIMSGLLLMTALMLAACGGGANNSKPTPAKNNPAKAPANGGDSGKETPAVEYDYVVGIEGMG